MALGSKHAFWQAFIVTVAVFFIGLFLGMYIESQRVDEINEFYASSEIALMDLFALNSLVSSGEFGCEVAIDSNLKFADRIYNEAILLEEYETAEQLGDQLSVAHRKYDLLRTFLWINAMEIKESCKGEYNVVVYLYEQQTQDLAQRAEQRVWSQLLLELKEQSGGEVVLIPIAVDSSLESLDALVASYMVETYPVVIINTQVISDLRSAEELGQYIL